MTTYFQSLQMAVFVSMPVLNLATGESRIRNLGPSFFARFVPYVVSVVVATKLTGGSSQRIASDFYFALLRKFTFLRALPTLVTGGRRLRFRVTPKAPERPRTSMQALPAPRRRGPQPRRGRHPRGCAPAPRVRYRDDDRRLRERRIIAAFYALTLVRLWRRVYRRHHYRVPVALGGWVATNNDAGADEIVARTKDISFGGASLVLARSIKPGARVRSYCSVPNRSQSTARSSAAPPADADSHLAGVSFDTVGPEDEERLLLVVLEAAVEQRERGPRQRPQPASSAARRSRRSLTRRHAQAAPRTTDPQSRDVKLDRDLSGALTTQ